MQAGDDQRGFLRRVERAEAIGTERRARDTNVLAGMPRLPPKGRGDDCGAVLAIA